MPNTVELQHVLRAPPERVYKAFIDPDAMVKWSPPNGFVGKVHSIDAKIGGSYSMSFTNFATGTSYLFDGTYHEMIPGERLVYSDKFDNPKLPDEMRITITFKKVFCGTELKIMQEGLPDVIPPEVCRMGWQESLVLLGKLVEAEIPDS